MMSPQQRGTVARTILRWYAKHRGWGSQEIAEVLGWGRRTVSELRSGKTQSLSVGRYLDLLEFAEAHQEEDFTDYAGLRVKKHAVRRGW